jgi:hypothetical protein
VKADLAERDREAWNLPRAPAKAAPQRRDRVGLDWDSFRDLYYPSIRGHDDEVVVAYGAHKRSPDTSPAVAAPKSEPTPTGVSRLLP